MATLHSVPGDDTAEGVKRTTTTTETTVELGLLGRMLNTVRRNPLKAVAGGVVLGAGAVYGANNYQNHGSVMPAGFGGGDEIAQAMVSWMAS